jgi:hypothetical protein
MEKKTKRRRKSYVFVKFRDVIPRYSEAKASKQDR